MKKQLLDASVVAAGIVSVVLIVSLIVAVVVASLKAETLTLEAVLNIFQAFEAVKVLISVATAAAAAFFGYVIFDFSFASPSSSKNEKILRGAREMTTRKMQSAVNKLFGKKSRFSFGDVNIPFDLETRNFLIVGSPGTGKSVAITSALDALRAHDAAGIVADVDGIYISRFAKKGDVLLNPLDKRSIKWSPLAEIDDVTECVSVARSLIPDGQGSSKEWNTYAQVLLEGVLEFCWQNKLTNADIVYYMLEAEIDELQSVLRGKAARMYAEPEVEKMFLSIRSIAATYIKALKLLPGDAGVENSFSIKRFITSERKNWIFLTYTQLQRDALSSLIACALDAAARAILSLPPDRTRRFVYAIDEFSLLPRIDKIVDLLTNGRKYGAVVMLGMQSVAQIEERYGKQTAQAILASLQTILATRCADHATAEFVSKQIGDAEVIRIMHSTTRTHKEQNVTKSAQVQTQRALLASQIQALQDLNAILSVAGVGFTRVKLQLPKEKPAVVRPFVAREEHKVQEHAHECEQASEEKLSESKSGCDASASDEMQHSANSASDRKESVQEKTHAREDEERAHAKREHLRVATNQQQQNRFFD